MTKTSLENFHDYDDASLTSLHKTKKEVPTLTLDHRVGGVG